jgi:erythronate-4-phosphate dehydrogenase
MDMDPHPRLRIAVDSNSPFGEEAFGAIGEVRRVDTGAFTQHILRDVDVLIVRSETAVNAGLLEGTPVKFVGTLTIGTDHIDTSYLRSRGITFASAPGSNANSVKEYVVAALLGLGHRYGFCLKGKILGVVGVGNIGSRVVGAADALGMTVLQNDPPLRRKTGNQKFLRLDELMSADILTLHVPLTREGEDATYHLFNAERIRKMKPGAILLNTSRGSVVDTGALLDALNGRHLGGAVLDVWEKEPAISPDLLEKVTYGTPHIAGYSLDGKVNAVNMVQKAVRQYFGVGSDWDPTGRLPRPERDIVRLPSTDLPDDEILRHAVEPCYAIQQDDDSLRKLLTLPVPGRPGHFASLRTGYRLRREFMAYSIEIPPRLAPLRARLQALGFTLL